MKELRKFQSSAFDTMARRKFIDGQNTLLELSGRVQELQNEVNCINTGKLIFANTDASSSAPYPQELHQWNSSLEEPLHSSTVEKSERQEQDQDQRCQSGP